MAEKKIRKIIKKELFEILLSQAKRIEELELKNCNQKLDSKSFIEDYKFHQKYGVEYRIVNVNKKFYEHYIYSKKKSNDFYNYNVLGIGYAEGHSKNHAISFTNDIFFDSSDNTIFTLPEDEKISTIESQQLLRELIQYYIKKCD